MIENLVKANRQQLYGLTSCTKSNFLIEMTSQKECGNGRGAINNNNNSEYLF